MSERCEVIRDLLPLYADGVCSEGSRALVEEHIQTCPECRATMARMLDGRLEEDLHAEKQDVLRYGERRFRRRTTAVGSIVSAVFMVPILVCLIVNLSTGAGLSWFFIVLASLGVAASLILVPLTVPEDKAFWTFCAFCVSLVLLLGVICFVTGGRWFWIVSSAALFGLSVIFLPFVIRAKPVRQLIGNGNRLLIVLGVDGALFLNMMNMISANGGLSLRNLVLGLAVAAGIVMVVMEVLSKKEENRHE